MRYSYIYYSPLGLVRAHFIAIKIAHFFTLFTFCTFYRFQNIHFLYKFMESTFVQIYGVHFCTNSWSPLLYKFMESTFVQIHGVHFCTKLWSAKIKHCSIRRLSVKPSMKQRNFIPAVLLCFRPIFRPLSVAPLKFLLKN